MIAELRRRAYLSAMQVASWLPRVDLPFAAPSRDEVLNPEPLEPLERPVTVEPYPAACVTTAPQVQEAPATQAPPRAPAPRLSIAQRLAGQTQVTPAPEATPQEPVLEEPQLPPPRFALQVLRAGQCLLLVELATGEPFQSRDPSYLLLKDLLRTAGLPEAPRQVGDGSPIRWPLLSRGSLDQGPQAACDYVQGVLAGYLEQEPCQCVWLIGLPALRFAGEVEADAYLREVPVESLGVAWALPSLELLMDEPARKAELWRVMQRVMPRWSVQ